MFKLGRKGTLFPVPWGYCLHVFTCFPQVLCPTTQYVKPQGNLQSFSQSWKRCCCYPITKRDKLRLIERPE